MTASDPSPPKDGLADDDPPIPDIDPDLPRRILAAAPRVRTFLRRLCRGSALRCDADVDDLHQDVLQRALRYRHAFEPTAGSLESWLMKIAFHTFLDHREQSRRRPHDLGADAAELLGGGGDRDAADVRDELAFLLAQLSGIEQDVVLRFHRQRESIAEIAAALGMPGGTVKSHLHRARQKLARHERGEGER